MKVWTKALSLFLTVIILLSAVPLGGFAGLDFSGFFASDADAAVNYGNIEFSAEDYIAGIILNTNKQSCAVSGNGKSVASMTLDYYTQPQNISLSKCYTEALEGDADFMFSVAAWEVLTFEPTDIYSETMTKIGYYQTILFDILEVAVDYNIVPSIVKNMSNHVIATLKSINELEIKVDDIIVNGDTRWDVLDIDQQNKIIQKTAGRMTELEMRNQGLSDFTSLVKVCTTVADFVEKAAQLTALVTLTEDVKAVINELYSNCSYIDNMDLKSAILELKNAMNSNMDNIGTIGLDMLCSTGKLSMDIFLSQMWGEVVTACLGSIGAGLLIGQVIGRGLSNILFSTDKTIEQFYTMQALADIELLMCKTVKSLGQKYIASQNTTNASNFLKSIDLLYNTYKLDFEYTEDFAEIIYTKGLINKVKLFVSGTPDSLEQIKSIVQSCRNSLALSLGMITDIDNYCWYLETDYPDVYEIYYGGLSYEDMTNNYVKNVRLLTVACPTDVDVYDNNELIISVKNDLVELCKPGYVCNVEDDVKHIMLTTDKQLSVRITGTADGKMTYTVCEGNQSGFDRKMVFKDIVLTQGCTYDTVVPKTIYENKEKYNLISDSGEKIECNSDSLIQVQDDIVDVIVAEELFDGFPVEVIDLVADTMFNMKSVVDLSAYDISTDDAVALFSAIAKYYPAEYSLIANGDFTYKIIVSPELDRIMKIRFYYGDDANLSTYQKRVKDLNAEIDALVAQVQGMNDFEKALYIHDYIVLNSEYDLELLDYMEKNNFILPGELRSEKYTEYSILVNGTGVCGSYALAYRAVMNAAGVECLYLSSRQMNHAWNLVKIDGEWYHVDCCWDDPVPDTYGRARRTYFLRTDEEIMSLNHYAWSPGQYKAISKKYSEMSRKYDYDQKYENGYWYYINSGDIVKSDVYGTNTEVLAENIYANAIAVDGGNVYYAKGRYIYKYNDGTDTSVLASYLTASECGDKPEKASIRNMYIDETGQNVIVFKNIYEDEEYKTIKTTVPIESEKYESITGIKLSDSELSLDIFTSKTITAEFEQISEFADFEIVFSSSDESIAVVSENGEITARNIGTATITASFDTYSETCEVTVTGDGLSGTCDNDIAWSFDKNTRTLTVSGEGEMENYTDSYISSSNLPPWYKFRTEIENFVAEKGITKIGDYSLNHYPNLESVFLSETVLEVGASAFASCFNLKDVELSNGLVKIGNNAFDGCENITAITLPESVTSIGVSSFSNCSKLTEINLPAEITTIGATAFVDCSKLTEISIPEKVSYIGDRAFNNSGLVEFKVSIDNTNYSVDEYGILFNKDKTVLVEIPDESKVIDYTIPDSVTNIGPFALWGVKNIVNLTISANVASMSVSSIRYCEALQRINVVEDNEYYSSDQYGVLFNKDKSRLVLFPIDCKLTRYNIPLSVQNISQCAFESCNNLKCVIMPDSVTKLGALSFHACEELICVKLSPNIENIELMAFSNCDKLKNVIIPANVEKLGMTAFASSNFLEKVCVLSDSCRFGSGRIIYGEAKILGYENSTAHTYSENYGNEFFAIDTEPHEHDYFLLDYIEYTDTTDGYEYWECYCGEDSYTKVVHHFGEEVVTAPSCTVEGTTFVTCTICGEVEIRATTEATGKHNFELTSTTPGDCETAPVYHYTCSVCGETQDKTGRIDDGHDYVETVTPPSCTKKGSTIATCSRCGETVIYDFVSPKGHTLRIKNTASYCSAHDSLEYSCITCDYTEVIAANTDELETEKITVEPTCTEAGKEIEKCTLCGATVSEKILRALSHDYSDEFSIDKEASCVENGEKSKHCSRCDARREITVLSALGHAEGEWTITEATCTADGEKIKTCTVCGDTVKTETIPALGHTESEWVITEPTCTKDGAKTKTCTVCNAVVESETIKATGHTEGEWITESEPTCIKDGKRIKKCTVCDEVVSVKTINATGHKDSDADNFCDECSEDLTEKAYCPCVCHKSGIIGFIWKIIRIIMMVFRVSPVCDCGIAHY